jgi:putative redox protein
MKVELKRLNQAVHFEARNSDGQTVHLDGGADEGGEDKGFRPMQMVLMGMGGCTAIDVVVMLKKMRQAPDDIQVQLEAQRAKNTVPRVFTDIHVHYILKGKLEEEKVQRAIELSLRKYCSVSKMLEKTATITYSFELID